MQLTHGLFHILTTFFFLRNAIRVNQSFSTRPKFFSDRDTLILLYIGRMGGLIQTRIWLPVKKSDNNKSLNKYISAYFWTSGYSVLAFWNMIRRLFAQGTAHRPTTFAARLKRFLIDNVVATQTNWNCHLSRSANQRSFLNYNFTSFDISCCDQISAYGVITTNLQIWNKLDLWFVLMWARVR